MLPSQKLCHSQHRNRRKMYFSPCVLTLLWGLDDLLVKMSVSCLHNRYNNCKLSVHFGHCERAPVGIDSTVWLLVLADSLQTKPASPLLGMGQCWCWEFFYLEQLHVLGRDGGLGCQAAQWVRHASAGRACLYLCQLPAVLLRVLWHVVGASEWGREAICSHVTFPTSKLFLQLLAQPAPAALAGAAGYVFSFLSAVGLFSLLLQEGFRFMSFLPAACCVGQAACHVLESLLPTPLPCRAIASLSARPANTHLVLWVQMLRTCSRVWPQRVAW